MSKNKIVRECLTCKGQIPIGRHKDQFCSKRCQILKEGYAESTIRRMDTPSHARMKELISATTAWKPIALEPVIHVVSGYPILVLSDVHCPLHSEAWLHQAIICAKAVGARTVIINGDFIDANQISRHAGSYYRRKSELEDDFLAGEAVLKILCAEFEMVYILMGNHCMRLIHQMGGELSVQRMYKMFGEHKNLKITARSFVDVNTMIRCVHPRQYSKIRGKIPSDLAQRWQKSVITGHQHHSAQTISPCGKFQAVDVGCIADTHFQDYVRNECTTYVEPINGFVLIHGDRILALDKFSPWKMLGLPEFKE